MGFILTVHRDKSVSRRPLYTAFLLRAEFHQLLGMAQSFGRHALAGIQLDEVQRASAGIGRLVELGYWIMPKPADFSLILADALGTEQFAAPWLAFKAVREAGHFHPWASVASSLIAGAVFLAIAGYEFVHDEY